MDIQKGKLNVPDNGEYKVIYPETSSDQVFNVVGTKRVSEEISDIYTQLSDLGVNAKSLGIKGDGVTPEHQLIYSSIIENDTIFFPDGDYILGDILSFQNVSNKTIIFSKNARIIQRNLTGSNKDIISFRNCENITIKDIYITDGEKGQGNRGKSRRGINIQSCKNFKLLGNTEIDFTNSFSIYVYGNSSDIHIDTITTYHLQNANAIVVGSGYNISINHVYGYGGYDDLVVLKTIDGPTYDVWIGTIYATNNCFGAFAIGSELWGGDLYNVTVENIFSNSRYVVFIKMWSMYLPEGETMKNVYNINFGNVSAISQPGGFYETLTPINFDINSTDFLGKVKNINFNNIYLEGSFYERFAIFTRCEDVTINKFTIKSVIPEGETRDVNRAIRLRDGCKNIRILSGELQGTDYAFEIYTGSATEQNNYNELKNLKFTLMNKDNTVKNTGVLIRVYNGYNQYTKISDCDLTSPSTKQIELLDARAKTATITNCRGRNDLTSAPTSGYYYVGEKINKITPVAGGYSSLICITEGSPGVFKGEGKIQE